MEKPLFRCSICGSTSYVAIHVRRPSGAWYRTEFYRCFGCSAMFTDPVAFTRRSTGDAQVSRVPDFKRYGGALRAPEVDGTAKESDDN